MDDPSPPRLLPLAFKSRLVGSSKPKTLNLQPCGSRARWSPLSSQHSPLSPIAMEFWGKSSSRSLPTRCWSSLHAIAWCLSAFLFFVFDARLIGYLGFSRWHLLRSVSTCVIWTLSSDSIRLKILVHILEDTYTFIRLFNSIWLPFNDQPTCVGKMTCVAHSLSLRSLNRFCILVWIL